MLLVSVTIPVVAILLAQPFFCKAQDCRWTSIINLVGEKNSPGSDASFSVQSTSTLEDGIRMTWSFGGATAVQHTYNLASSSFTTVSTNERYTSSVTIMSADVLLTNLTIGEIQLSEDNSPVRVTRTSCSGTTGDGGTLQVRVENCSNDAFLPNANAREPGLSCGYECSKTFDCGVCQDINFVSKCEAAAVWSTPSATCVTGCPRNVFGAGMVGLQACGTVARFTCDSSLVCREKTFTPACSPGATWSFTKTDDICFKSCDHMKDPHAGALGLGITWGLAFLIFNFQLIMKLCGRSCESDCCKPKDNCCCNCYIRVFDFAETFAGCCCCCCCCGCNIVDDGIVLCCCFAGCKIGFKALWWIGFGITWLIFSLMPYGISLALLLVSVTDCCSGELSKMIPGIILGIIAIAFQIFFTVLSFSELIYDRAKAWKPQVSKGSNGNGRGANEAQVGSSSREEGAIKSTNLSTASDGNRG